MPFFLDTDAISELLRPWPLPGYAVWLKKIPREDQDTSAVTVGEVGNVLPDADLQIAATALFHGLELVTGNLRHFQRIRSLRVSHVLAVTRHSH